MSTMRLIVSCGSSHRTAVLIERSRSGGRSVRALGSTEVSFRRETRGEGRGGQSERNAWSAALEKVDGKGVPAMLVVSHSDVTYRNFQIAEVGHDSLDAVVRFEAAQVLGPGAAEAVWEGVPMAARDGRVEVLLVSAPLARVEGACADLHAVGVRLDRAMDAGLALAHAYRYTFSGETTRAGLIVRVGARTTQLVLIEGSRVQIRALAQGGEMVTRDLAGVLGKNLEEAEAWKRRVVAPAGRDLCLQPEEALALARVTGDLAGRLQLEITRFLVNQRRPGAEVSPVTLHLCGGGTLLPGLAEGLAARLSLPVEPFDPFCRFGWQRAEPPTAIERARAAECVGAALFDDEALAAQGTASLLPPVRQRVQLSLARHTTLAGAAALLALAGLPPTWHYQRLAEETAASVRTLDAEVQRLQRIHDQNRENLAKIAEARDRMSLMRDLAAARNRWPRFFGELQTCLARVEDAWLDSLHLAKTGPGEKEVPLRFRLTGRLLDEAGAGLGVGADAEGRLRTLFTRLEESPFVARVERERFTRIEPGVLQFEMILAMSGAEPL